MRHITLFGLLAASILTPAAVNAAEMQTVQSNPIMQAEKAASDRDDRRGRGEHRANRQRQSGQQSYRQGRRDGAQQARQNYRRSEYRDERRDRARENRAYRDGRQDQRQNYSQRRRHDDRVEYRGQRYDRWDNNNWRNDRRYNWQGHRHSNRNAYRPGRYHSPGRGRGYSRFSVGFTIGSPYYASNYWINDPWSYRLPSAYGPYRWVRYYDDVLLVDIRTGYVVDIEHNFFW